MMHKISERTSDAGMVKYGRVEDADQEDDEDTETPASP